jgi:hypothetical protein
LGSTLSTTNNSIGSAVHGARTRSILVHVAAIIVLALSLGSVDAFLGSKVADGLEEAALADLAGGEVVNAILESVYLFDACDFGLVEVF